MTNSAQAHSFLERSRTVNNRAYYELKAWPARKELLRLCFVDIPEGDIDSAAFLFQHGIHDKAFVMWIKNLSDEELRKLERSINGLLPLRWN